MEFQNLNQDRFLRKDPNQTDETKGSVYAVLNPAPKRGDDSLRKIGRPKGSEEDDGAPNVLTGTVITSCFIQTSALPSRIELQGNDLTFFDDTYNDGGEVIGDTSRLIFTHASGKEGNIITEGFIMEKRASIHDTYDNIFSFYALPPKQGKMNQMFFGFEGSGTNFETNSIQFTVNHQNNPVTQDIANGKFSIGGAIDGDKASIGINLGVFYNSILGVPGEGYSVFLTGTGTGFIIFGSTVIPATADIDLGTVDNPFRKIYAQEVVGAVSSEIITIESTQSWAVPTGVTKVQVEGVGGGAGGSGSTDGISGTSGGGAGYCRKIVDLTGVPSVSITVGTGGAGGAAGSNPGADGNDTTFGAYFTASGGNADGTGGTATGGDLNIPGNMAGPGTILYGAGTTTNRSALSGQGGGTFFGPGAVSSLGGIASQASGNSGIIYGAGGSGAATGTGGSNETGGTGKDGVIVITIL